MPSTIPYNPSLTLTNVVHSDALTTIKQIAKVQAPVDARRDELNSLLATRSSLDMTINELVDLNLSKEDVSVVTTELKSLDTMIATTAKDYIKAKIEAEKELVPLRSTIAQVNSDVESPVDYVKSQFKTLPLAADSMNMDVQYFSRDSNSQNSKAYSDTIADYVSSSTSFLGKSFSEQATSSARSQVAKQISKHDILGTLVIAVACTHKNALVMAPCVINPDKAIKCWNQLIPDNALDPTSEKEMAAAIAQPDDANAKSFSILSGTTFGSSFIGMVHILNNTETRNSETLESFAAAAQEQLSVGAWFEKETGGFGVNDSFSQNVKDLLSSQSINSHVTVIAMGAIPSIVASDVQLAVAKFAKFDPAASMEEVATIQNATSADQDSVSQAAASARLGQQMVSLKSAQVTATLSALDTINDNKNKILDVNSMMTALDDYLKKAREDNAGVPINYYTKEITRKMLAEMWVSKYFPGKYTTIKYEDGSGDSGAAGQNTSDNTSGGNTSGGNTSGSGGDTSGGSGGDSSGGAADSSGGGDASGGGDSGAQGGSGDGTS